ncbi:MAG TPA: rRNA methyltransferase [Cytophagales bacterium]|nr:rRNA methyltransferase [Cytophagales bacterium]
MDGKDINRVADHLAQYITDHKRSLIENILHQRTRHLTLVLEDIFQSQNASAVFRTAECFGIQDVHLIENQNSYGINPRVLKGANKWLNIVHHNKPMADNTPLCFEHLRANGYKILATSPSAQLSIREVNVTDKIAIVMGNELHGLSDYAQSQADLKVKIPMEGFTESLNLSVSAAICIYELMTRLKASPVEWGLSQQEQDILRLTWYRKTVKRSELIEKQFLESIK